MSARHEGGCYEKKASTYFLVFKGLLVVVVVLSNDDVGVVRGTVFREIRPGASFKSTDFVKGISEGLLYV